MKTASRAYRWVIALAVGAAVVAVAAASALAAGRPAGMSAAEYRAMLIRGQALNRLYGLDVPAGMTAQQWRAMVARGQGMNDLYVTEPAASAPVPPVAAVPADGFDWTDAGIGAAIALGAVLVGTGLTFGARRTGHWRPHPGVS